MERRQTPSPIEQLKQLSAESDEAWEQVIEDLKKATLELIDITDEERVLLDESFWSVHPVLLKRAEQFQPGVAERIFKRFEEIAAERRSFEAIQFHEETLPKAKRIAFLRGLIGLPPKLQ